MKNTLTATFEIVTPMFLGGADQTTSSIRPASIKGALRFWWRALNWGRFAAQYPGSEYTALQAMHAEEARLFGIAADEKSGGQGVFLLQTKTLSGCASDVYEKPEVGSGLSYLMGQGIPEAQRKGEPPLKRNAMKSGKFDVSLIFKPKVEIDAINQVLTALQVFGLLGALGSRSRHGLGSVQMVGVQSSIASNAIQLKIPNDRVSLSELLKGMLNKNIIEKEMPPFSAFSGYSRVEVSAMGSTSLAILEKIGRAQQLYRSYGYRHQSGQRRVGTVDVSGKQKFVGDHDLIQKVANDRQKVDHAPLRTVFGLPHNYKYSTGNIVNINFKQKSEGGKWTDARRASPLLLHINRFGSDFFAIHTFLPGWFLPEDGVVFVGNNAVGGFTPKWSVVTDYLEEFKEKEVIYD